MTTFTNIYKNELKSKGILSSLGSTALKRTRERLDPRNMLFGGSGMIAATGQKIFGKGYSAIQSGSGSKLSTKTAEVSGLQSEAVSSLLTSSLKQETQLAIIAKNTMNNNAMARDMNVMRQNVMKLVTMGGGKASRGADMFFKDAKARESEYESKFKKGAPTITPTPVKQEKEKSGGILGMLATLAGPLLGVGKLIVSTITSALSGLGEIVLKGLSAIFSVDTLRAAFGITSSIFSGLSKLLPLVMNPAFLGVIAAVAGATWLAKWISDKNDEANTQEKTDLRIAQDRGSNSQKLAARTFLINDDLKSYLKDDRTDADVSELTRGEITTKADLAKAISSAEASGKRAIEIKDSKVVGDAKAKLATQAQKSMDDGSYAQAEARRLGTSIPQPASTSPEKVDYESRVGARESGGKYDTIFGKAGGAMINGKLITENTIAEVVAWQESERAKKSNKQAAGKYQFMDVGSAAKAAGLNPDDLFNGPNQEKMMQAYTAANAKSLERLGLPSTTEYLSMAHAVGAAGAKKLIDAQNAGEGSKNSLEILGLKGASAQTNPQLNTSVDNTIAKLKGIGSSTGTALASASTASSDLNRASSTQQPPIVNVNAPQTTNVAGGKGGEQQVASATNIDALDLFFKFAM